MSLTKDCICMNKKHISRMNVREIVQYCVEMFVLKPIESTEKVWSEMELWRFDQNTIYGKPIYNDLNKRDMLNHLRHNYTNYDDISRMLSTQLHIESQIESVHMIFKPYVNNRIKQYYKQFKL